MSVLCILLTPLPVGAEDEQEHGEAFGPAAPWLHPERVRVREGDLLFNDPYRRDFQSRSYFFTGFLNDSIHFDISVFQWTYSAFGAWGLLVVVEDPESGPFVYEKRISDHKLSVASDRFYIRFGKSVLEGRDGAYRVRLEVEGFACDLSFDSLLPPWQPGDGYAYLRPDREAYMRLGVAAPFADVRGTLVTDGNARAVSGWGYADRGLLVAPIDRMNSFICSFRAFSPHRAEESWFVSMLQFQSHPQYGSREMPVLLVVQDRSWVMTSRELSFVPAEPEEGPGAAYPYPRRFRVQARQGEVSFEGDFVCTSLYYYADVFQELPGILRAVAEFFFDRPVIFRMLGYFRGAVTLPGGERRLLYLPGHAEYQVIR